MRREGLTHAESSDRRGRADGVDGRFGVSQAETERVLREALKAQVEREVTLVALAQNPHEGSVEAVLRKADGALSTESRIRARWCCPPSDLEDAVAPWRSLLRVQSVDAEDAFVALARPDGYLAFTGRETSQLVDYLDHWFVKEKEHA